MRVSRYERLPEMGPKMLFFSGGSALNDFSKKLKHYTHNSIHLMTPFDSGGSSAVLRQAFDMPAIGDLRARLMALADDSVRGLPDVFRLFSHRLSKTAPHPVLESQLLEMVEGNHPMVLAISEPMRQLIRNQLQFFHHHKPDNFNLRGASIGNLILSGGYLNNAQHLDPIIFLFSKLVEVQGTVRLTVDDNYHLAVELANGESIVGQHRMTGKENAPIRSSIENMYLVDSLDNPQKVDSHITDKHQKMIETADLLCFPPGSFYSSVLANLLPKGVGSAIAKNSAPKVYIPSLGTDPEMLGKDLNKAIATILHYIKRDLDYKVESHNLLSHVLVDSQQKNQLGLDTNFWSEQGVQIVEADLVDETSSPYYQSEKLLQALLSFT